MEQAQRAAENTFIAENDITEKIIGCAIKVHRALGPGLLESAYEECLYYELKKTNLKIENKSRFR